MTLGNALPFGCRELVLWGYQGTGGDTFELLTPPVKIPVARKLTFSEVVDTETLIADDAIQALHGSSTHVQWDLESGGISLDAYAVLAGGTVVTEGVGPDEIKTYTKSEGEPRPYFRLVGRALNDDGGDLHTILYRCKAEEISGEFADGSFFITSCSGLGIGSRNEEEYGRIYDFIHSKTGWSIL